MKSRILAVLLSIAFSSYAYGQAQLPAKTIWGNNSSGRGLAAPIPYATLSAQLVFGCSQLPALTGDVTSSAGSCATAIANNAVALSKLATQSPNTALVNATGGTAVPTAFPMPSCSTATSALFWTANTGFGCHTITAGAVVSVTDPAYGAICSGNVADAAANTTAFTNALATGRNVFVPYCSLGYNFGTNFVPMASNQSIFCENQATVLYGQGAKLFYISSLGPETKIENCTVQMAGGVVGATAFLLKTSTGVVNGVTLRNVRCLYTYHCYDDEGTNAVAFFTADSIYTTQTYGLQFRLRNSNGFIRLKDLECDFTGETGIGLVTWGCGDHANFIGITVSGLNTATGVGVGTPVFVTNNPAWKFSAGQAMWVYGTLFADHTAGDGILIDTVQYLWADKLEGSINLGTPVTISNSTDANVSNLICYGAVGQTGAAASKTGCDINNVNIANFSNIYEKNSTGTGVTIRGTSQSINAANLIATVNTGGGLAVQNSATNINIANAFVGGNTGTAYSNTSSGAVFISFASGGTQWFQQTAPGSPASGNLAMWFDTTDARFHDKNASGTTGTTVVADAGAANNFLTGIGPTGGITKAQPNFNNFAGSATCAQLPALTGDVTTPAGSCATTLATVPTAKGGTGQNWGASSGIPNLTTGTAALITPGSGIDISGSTLQITAARRTLPTHQFLTTGTNATYTTTSANVLYIRIRMVGGGAGGAGGGSGAPGAGTGGGTTCWNTSGTACTSPMFTATGGSAATGASGLPTIGGTGSSCNVNILGGDGAAGGASLTGSFNGLGGVGGASMFGGGGGPTIGGGGNAGAAFGSGGAGGAANSAGTNNSGSGGGAGGGCEHWISAPAATYVYTIGAGGTAGGAGTNGSAGGAGKIGYIVVDEFYN